MTNSASSSALQHTTCLFRRCYVFSRASWRSSLVLERVSTATRAVSSMLALSPAQMVSMLPTLSCSVSLYASTVWYRDRTSSFARTSPHFTEILARILPITRWWSTSKDGKVTSLVEHVVHFLVRGHLPVVSMSRGVFFFWEASQQPPPSPLGLGTATSRRRLANRLYRVKFRLGVECKEPRTCQPLSM